MLQYKTLRNFQNLIRGMTFFVGIFAAMQFFQVAEIMFFPIKDLKKIEALQVRGDDVWVAGEFRKLRSSCVYIQPARGTDLTDGRNLSIISHNKTAGQNWVAEKVALDFGPWQVMGAAGTKFKLYQEYQCNPLWRQFDELFEIDATNIDSPTYKVLK